jgi:hypothetical protein
MVRSENLIKFRRKRHVMNAADVTEMLKDPKFQAMMEFRKKVIEIAKKYNDNE